MDTCDVTFSQTRSTADNQPAIPYNMTLTSVSFEPVQQGTTSHNRQLATPTIKKIGKYQRPAVATKAQLCLQFLPMTRKIFTTVVFIVHSLALFHSCERGMVNP